MIQRIKTIIFPNVCVSFTLVMVLFCSITLVSGGKIRGLEAFAVELFAVLWTISLICIPIDELKLKKAFLYPLLELCTNYAVCLTAAYLFQWMRFNLYNVIWLVVLITAFYMNIYFRTKRQISREAGQINRLIQERG